MRPEPLTGDEPSDEQIEQGLLAAPAETWPRLRAALDQLETEQEHSRWAGGEQIDTIFVDGVEQHVIQMAYVVHSEAVDQAVEVLYELQAVIPFEWSKWDGVERYRGGAGLGHAPVADAVRMTTAIIRADRFCEGTIAAALDDGTFRAALRRLWHWYDAERHHF